MRDSPRRTAYVVLGVALGLVLATLGWASGLSSSQAQDDTMHNCPQAGKWSIATWDGANGTSTEQAMATCGEDSINLLYWLDPDSQGWKRYISGRPEVSNLNSLNNHQGVLALGSVAGPSVSPTPTGLSPSPTPTAGTTGDVTLVSSNAFTTTSSLLIDGESRRMHVVGELRNESAMPRSAGEIKITIYDAAEQVVGTRWALAFDDIIMPGRTTAFAETYPSGLYMSNETNDFPEGWTRYEVTLSPRDPYEWEELPVDVAVQNVQVTDGGGHVTGDAVNASSKTVDQYGVDVYVIYYRADGTILNTERDIMVNDQPLGPGESAAFDISFSSGEPVDFNSYVAQAYAEPE